MSSKKFNPFKDFHTDQIQRSSRKMFTAHYAHRNADLNLTLVLGTTNSGGPGEGLACEPQTHFRSSFLSLRNSYFSEGEKQRPEMRLRFAG